MRFIDYIFDNYFRSAIVWILSAMGTLVPIAEWKRHSLTADDFVFLVMLVALIVLYYKMYRNGNS